jgi:ParB family chromosome partitioning protein
MSSSPPQLLSVDAINLSAINVRQDATDGDDHIATLSTDIAHRGLMHPITVRPAEAGYEVIAGRRRLRAHQQLGKAEILARVVEVDDDAGFLLSLSENMHRHPMSSRAKCAAIKRCFDAAGSVAAVCGQTHLAETTVRRYLQVSALPEAELARLDAAGAERLTLHEAVEMAKGATEAAEAAAEAQPDPDPDGPPPTKRPRRRPVKSEPWVYGPDDKPLPIPEALWSEISAAVARHTPDTQ